MTVIRWGAQNPRFTRQAEYEAACARAARFFIEQHDGQVVLFPQVWGPSVSQDDRVAARRVAEHLHDLNRVVFMIEDPLSPDLLKAVYGLTDLFVGTRMHSNIFCLSEGVPVIAIGYQPKTRGIIQMVGLERWMIDIERVSGQALIGLLEALWNERDSVREHLRRTIPLLVQQGSQAGVMIAADYAVLHDRGRCARCL
jgi:colanic acid/amylovoran biosynthesis protein